MSELTEQQIQNRVIKWANRKPYNGRVLGDYISHPPLGGRRGSKAGAMMRHSGAKKGYPDLIVDIPSGEYHGLRIEIKKLEGGRVSDEQELCMEILREQGYKAEVCCGYDAVINEIKDYLGIK